MTADLVKLYRSTWIGRQHWPIREKPQPEKPRRGTQLKVTSPHGTRPGVWGQARRGTRSALLLETAAKLGAAGQAITVRSLAEALQADPKRIWAAVSVLVQRGEWPHARPGERRA